MAKRAANRHSEEFTIDTTFAVLVLVRWLHFASMFVVFGSSAAVFYLGPRPGSGHGVPWTVARARPLIRSAALVAFASGLGWLAATLATMSGGFAGVFDRDFLRVFFFETPFGPIAAARLLLLAVLLVPAVLPMRTGSLVAVAATLGALLLVSQAWLGHAAEGGDSTRGACMIVSYAVHVLAGALWAGGLPILLMAMAEQQQNGACGADILDLLLRFSAMAFVAVGAIVISGVANTAFRVGTHVPLLVATSYGKVLFVKLGGVAIMLGLALYNRFLAMPRLRNAGPDGRLATTLRASVGFEIVLGACVLGAAAVLGVTAPPQ